MIREAINELKKYTSGKKNTDKIEVIVLNLNRIIFALEEPEPVLDKIRAEIENLEYLSIEDGSDGYDKYIDQYEVLKIIDKYKTESEDKYGISH